MSESIEENNGNIQASGFVLTCQCVFLAMNWRWAYTELVVEMGHGGAWSPWLVLGIVFVVLTAFEFIYWSCKGINMRIKDPIRA